MRIGILKPTLITPEALEILKQIGEVVRIGPTKDDLGYIDVVWTGLDRFIGEELLEHAPRLICIATPATGETHIDRLACEKRGVRVVSFRERTELLHEVRATAEFTITLLLALIRHIPLAIFAAQRGGGRAALPMGTEIYGKTAGIIGYGRLGKIVGGYLQALGAKVVAFDPAGVDGGVLPVTLDELLRESDIVSLHASFSESNRHFLGRREFQLMKRGAIFVNTARGELVDELALLDALKSGRLAGAALDVRDGEHKRNGATDMLLEYSMKNKNLLLTPHIGGCTQESRKKTDIFLANLLVEAVHRGLGTQRGGGRRE